MELQTRVEKIFEHNLKSLSFIKTLNQKSITNAITGSSSLYIHGNFGRTPNDLDLYTSYKELTAVASYLGRKTKQINFPPISWVEIKEKNDEPHMIAKLECRFEDGSYFDFSMSDYLASNLKKYEFKGTTIYVVPPEEVLLLKLIAPRKTEVKNDLADVKAYLLENELDKEYFDQRAKEIGVLDVAQTLLQQFE